MYTLAPSPLSWIAAAVGATGCLWSVARPTLLGVLARASALLNLRVVATIGSKELANNKFLIHVHSGIAR